MGVFRGTQGVGVKGKSGRKPMAVELAKARAIRAAWNKVADEVESKDVEKVALPIALKDMVAKVGNADGSNLPPIQIYGGQSTRTVQGYTSNSQDIQPEQEDKSSSWGNISEQDNINTGLAD